MKETQIWFDLDAAQLCKHRCLVLELLTRTYLIAILSFGKSPSLVDSFIFCITNKLDLSIIVSLVFLRAQDPGHAIAQVTRCARFG